MTHAQDKTAKQARPVWARRSVLYIPANNARAMEKAEGLCCDSVIFDLEDAVGPDDKDEARRALSKWFAAARNREKEYIIRINALSSPWGREDLEAACACRPSAILLPKVNAAGDIEQAEALLSQCDDSGGVRLWAMMETPRGIANAISIADAGLKTGSRLDCFVVGTNDLAKETGVAIPEGRRFMTSWLMQIVLAARAAGLDALDGVYNDFRDTEGFRAECAEGRLMGFDGKTLIHPLQIEPANAAFGLSPQAIVDAREIAQAFAMPENKGKGVIRINGRMVERLHLEQAEKLLKKAATQQ
ncbi:HpcH/HpaI aldolase/citrate lyase family protein [Hoeflea poritis]|uniref:CoA ester lyase n=1 Tax=Hoeflea poritis TaxID=2993659 RepID=A0ABT4VKX4_9HYPH|nr:CoA ester lyase [Hoeflea poritis]MDA4845371.1 CoA ester lyase [Hoeflea poritis]